MPKRRHHPFLAPVTPVTPVTPALRRLGCLAALFLIAWGAAAGTAHAVVDPFYERLFSQGREALAEERPAEAARDLRLACFGMLEEPPRLAVCLSYLAAAQDAADVDLGALENTVERILEVERRFSAWSRAALPLGLREAVEALLVEHATPSSLQALPGLRGAAVGQAVERLRALPPEERRAELDRRMVLEPSEPTWRLLAVELEWESGNFPAALRSAETLLELQPDHRHARCLRGLAAAALGRCDDVDRLASDLDACPSDHPDLEAAREDLRACRESRRGGGGGSAESAEDVPGPNAQAHETPVAAGTECAESASDLDALLRRGEAILARDRRELFRSGLETAEGLAACRPESQALHRVAGELGKTSLPARW